MQSQSQPEALKALRKHLQRAEDLRGISGLMMWDQSTYMPKRGAGTRARQMALIGSLSHDQIADPALGRLIEKAEGCALDPASADADVVRMARYDHERAIRVPTEYVARFEEHIANTYEVWVRAREADDFELVRSNLERTLDLSLEYASFFPEAKHPADAFIEDADPGLTSEWVRTLFASLREDLVPLVDVVCAQTGPADDVMSRVFPIPEQRAFGEAVITALGFDFTRGRQDTTVHPFMVRFGVNDIRITTRFFETDFGNGLFSTVHEAGHAMYEQGIHTGLAGTTCAHGASMAVHESQSRLWENIVARSPGFWRHFYGPLSSRFEAQLGDIDVDTWVRAVNQVRRGLIRTEADELTYNLHVTIRFEIELDLLEGKLAVRDLPERWNADYERVLRTTPTSNLTGVLQDVHWYAGPIGGSFQGYAIGNVMASQFFAAAVEANPEIPSQIERGQFDTLRSWLTENVYQYGRRIPALTLVENATGRPLDSSSYLTYLRGKFGQLYNL